MNPHIVDVPAIDEKNTKNTLVELIPYKKLKKVLKTSVFLYALVFLDSFGTDRSGNLG
jgi:hypothetical protein